MKQLLVLVFISVVVGLTVAAQNSVVAPVTPTAEESVVFRAAQGEDKKASEALNAAIAKLPESEAYKKALDALNAAVAKLPETKAKEASYAKVLDEAYRLLAKKGLSSREWEPRLGPKGDLGFYKVK